MYPVYEYLGTEQKCEDIPLAFPPQHQDVQPGIEAVMTPRPISENPYRQEGGKLAGRVALITGGDSGIGRAVAYAFAAEGADIAFVFLNEQQDAKETREHVEAMGRRCLALQCDLRKESEAQKAVRQAIGAFGRLDVLVNNHAVQFVQKSILDISEQQLENTFRTNVFGFFFMIKAALPYLRRGASIINTTSVTAYQGEPTLIDYSATKGAILALTRSLSLSLESAGIRVNGVAPGPIWTPLIPASFSPKQVETFGTGTSKVPMKRAGQPYEVAGSYVFLASDDSSYMSGQVLHPNGGTVGCS
ncbi:SDR family oxidoreductase [Harryflintia acetispora]|uniref:SDR family oxidoreductase n=1 Tax=Harryflintia acetispora TaxID=1849041 RepID=UPI00189913F9|nr:SDR family oxidoreductase [Harryflintia acetispora]